MSPDAAEPVGIRVLDRSFCGSMDAVRDHAVVVMLLRISPHLTFDGQCRAAFHVYKRIFGGDLVTMLTYGDSPMASQTDPKWHDRIVHATLRLDDQELVGVDVLPQNYRQPQGFFVIVTVDDPMRAAKAFGSLADGGTIQLPFAATFWSPGFGVVVDRFGVPWEINSVHADSEV